MIKEKELSSERKIRFANGQGITLDVIKEAVSEEADKNGIPIAFYDEQIKFGGLIGGSVEDCIILYHPEHKKDYFNIIFRVTHQGSYAFLNISYYGQSKMQGKIYSATEARQESKEERRGLPLSQRIGHAIGSGIANGIMSIGASKKKFEEEQNWYAIVEDCIDSFCEG